MYWRLALMTRPSISRNERRSAGVRTLSMRCCAACVMGRSRSCSAWPFFVSRSTRRPAILDVHRPLEKALLLEAEHQRTDRRAIKRQSLGERVLIQTGRVVHADDHAELQVPQSGPLALVHLRGHGGRELIKPPGKRGRMARDLPRGAVLDHRVERSGDY
jgi:hypothetical protein